MPLTLPLTSPDRLEVFGADDTSLQIVWRNLGSGDLTLQVGNRTHRPAGADPMLGSAIVSQLATDRSHDIVAHVDDRLVARAAGATAAELPGLPLGRIATISDIHFGETSFGLVRNLRENPAPSTAHPMRCALAAVDELTRWGAELLVIKGDLTDRGLPEEWAMVDEFLEQIDIPVVAVPGNHDTTGRRGSLDGHTELRRRGLFPDPVQVIDHGGTRIVVVDTTVPTRGYGRVARHRDALLAAVDTDRPVLVFTHHHFEAAPVPWFWPLGIPLVQGGRLLDRLVEVNPNLVVSSGHTHRNRARRHGSALVTEVGSVKDHPGVWAGYTVHATGIRQTLRRVADPACLSWTETCRAAVAGIWGRWSPGGAGDRCVTHRFREPVRAVPEPAPLEATA